MSGQETAGGDALLEAGPLHAPVLAALHARSVAERAWGAAEMQALQATPGSFAFLAQIDGLPAGFVLARAVGGEAEIVLLAVPPERRRRGLARRLLRAACWRAGDLGAAAVLLEVAADNDAALFLYRKAGFAATATRRGYYRRPEGPPADAIVMRLDLPAGRSSEER